MHHHRISVRLITAYDNSVKMRIKQPPKLLSPKSRQPKSFFFHPNLAASLAERDLNRTTPSKRRKVFGTEEKELSLAYPHSINLLKEPACDDYLLQTISLPIEQTFFQVLGSQKTALFFNSATFVLMIHDTNAVQEYVFPAGEEMSALLFAVSSNQLEVYYRIADCSIYLDVCVRGRCIESGSELPARPVSKIQFAKVRDFMTLQSVDQLINPSALAASPDFVYGRHSETQSEFVILIKFLYDCAQQYHEESRKLWNSTTECVHTRSLNTRLRPYQIDAVKWMIHRESNLPNVENQDFVQAMFWPIQLSRANRVIYYSALTGTFLDQCPKLQPPCPGGIVADEMGLGKTLEVIALILTRPWHDWSVCGGQIRTLDGNAWSDLDNFDAPTPPLFDTDSEKPVLCSCGNVEHTHNLNLVICTCCQGPYQHAACVQYEPSKFMHNLPIQHGYICPKCWSHFRIDSKATLIVAPDHIWQQWKEELQTHVVQGALDVLLYAGMEAPVTPVEVGNGHVPLSALPQSMDNPYAPRTRVITMASARTTNWQQQQQGTNEEELFPGFVQPGQLASVDVVLTSYSVVQRELDWAEVIAERQAGLANRPHLRVAPRYLCRPSPLTCVRWWRVCLDEAQMVERVTSRTARMMSKIEAQHRWCITGTPAEKSIDDLFGLFAYLRFEPFSIPHYWHSLLYQPFLAATASSWVSGTEVRVSAIPQPTLISVNSTQLAKMLNRILWRNTKARVGDQLALPPITEQIHWISFTPVERYIHDRVLAQSAGALQHLSRTMSISPDQPLSSLPGTAHWRLVYLITRLRQACTHASLVVASGTHIRRTRSRAAGSQRSSPGHRLGYGACQSYGDTDADDAQRATYGSATCDGPSVSAARAQQTSGTGCSTMTEVIRRVVDDTRRECEGLLRSWVFNKNGAAGCFIIKQQYESAAECYRDVLRTATSLESHHGVLADCSQRLHAITNLHWLIQSRGVPLLDDPPSAPLVNSSTVLCNVIPSTGSADAQLSPLDPRVDRDLPAKAERLRLMYIQMHSHLLAKVHDTLRPITSDLDGELLSDHVTDADSDSEFIVHTYGAGWLTWTADALEYLIARGLGPNLIEMLVSSFQGKPGGYRSGYRTTLLHVHTVDSFKALLMTEVAGVFETRKRLRKAMEPVTKTWLSFTAGEEADPKILRPFYACCARLADTSEEDTEMKAEHGQSNKKKDALKNRELKRLAQTGSVAVRSRQKKTSCAYCVALRALSTYQCALNHERLKASYRTVAEQIELLDTADQSDEVGTGLNLGNPLIVALSIVCHQLIKVTSRGDGDWTIRAQRFEQLFRQMGKEILLTSRTLSLTKEWWNIHDDTEKFVVRLQATCPTDLAFVPSHEVESQMHSYIVDAELVWPRLQLRLGHFRFLRNAHLTAVTGLDRRTDDSDVSRSTHTFRLECPTCLQAHNADNPTFALLPGCWHSLCIRCHDRIASLGQSSQRRCPVCRAPFQSTFQTSGTNARRRRPLTLIHYAGGDPQTSTFTKPESDSSDRNYAVTGDHSSKVQAVLRCLKQIKDEDPDAKAIVFSSWLSVLVTIAGALEQNGLSYTTLFQPRDACCPGRLAGFQCFGSATWILLMPIQLGANGLNLTSANHVLLIDPVLSHAREAQAIARMHRIGQTRPSVVHRFLIRDSIEVALHTAQARMQSETMDGDVKRELFASDDCMIGAGPRRSCSTSYGVAGPGEDKAQLMQMTLGQLSELLQRESNSTMLAEELEWAGSHDPEH